jgi:hypothetical protein
MSKTKSTEEYSYEAWVAGDFATGGIQYKEYNVPLIPVINWTKIEDKSKNRIKAEQKKIFDSKLEIVFLKTIAHFNKMYINSLEKNILLEETLNDLGYLFHWNHGEYLHLRFINKLYSPQEVNKIQSFYNDHIIRGTRNYDFIQSKQQKSITFKNPPIELEAEVIYKFHKYIINTFIPSKMKLSHREIALVCYYSGMIITRENSNQILKDFGQEGSVKLYHHFSKNSKKFRRLECKSETTALNMLHSFEKVRACLLLKQVSLEEIDNDISALKSAIEEF